jgi:chromosome segregation ATPase
LAEEVQSLGRRFDHLSSRLLEQDQTFNQVKGDLRRIYQDNNENKQHHGEVADMVKAHQGEISLLRTENARAVQALREMLNGLKSQVNNIQSQNFTRGTEGGTISQEVGDELVRLMARVGI